MADRIQARAIRRCGELLRQIESASKSNLVQNRQEGARPSVTRTEAATQAGLSEHQRKEQRTTQHSCAVRRARSFALVRR